MPAPEPTSEELEQLATLQAKKDAYDKQQRYEAALVEMDRYEALHNHNDSVEELISIYNVLQSDEKVPEGFKSMIASASAVLGWVLSNGEQLYQAAYTASLVNKPADSGEPVNG